MVTFIREDKSLLPASSILSRQAKAINNNITASLDKLTYTDYVDSCKSQDRFVPFSLSKSDSNGLDVKLKVIKKDDNKDFQMVQNLRTREINFNQLMKLQNYLVVAAKNLRRGKT